MHFHAYHRIGSDRTAGAVCTGGIAGVEAVSQPACCVEECGLCGGSGCAEVGGVNSTLTANDCCSSEILESDVFCVDTGVAPCILTAGESSLVCHLSTLWRPGVCRKRVLDYFCDTRFIRTAGKLALQPMIPPKRFDIFFPLTGGCSAGLDAFRFSFKHYPTLIILLRSTP